MNYLIMNYKGLFRVMLVLVLFQSCSGNQDKGRTVKELHDTEEALVGANRILVQKDKEKIMAYVRRTNLTMKETPSGLWFGIQRYGFGAKAWESALVTVKYRVTLLDGTVCYDS